MISQLITKDQSRIKTNEYGKPYLIDNAFYFNISHTAGYVALAISDKRDIGIDIEQVHRQVDYKLILFSRRNIQYINSIGNSEEFIRE
jgi:phosphopantetheinyl transferase